MQRNKQNFPDDIFHVETKAVYYSYIRVVLWNAYRQCFSTRRLRAIFSPTSVHTGLVRTILARSALTALTRPPVDSEPMLTISTSFLDSFWTCRDKGCRQHDTKFNLIRFSECHCKVKMIFLMRERIKLSYLTTEITEF